MYNYINLWPRLAMIKWYLDKKSKIPLYLQLRDLIKYYISTGIIQNNERLPGVVNLAHELRINFETVRKAYKELEKEGLISVNRGKGTFAVLPQETLLPEKRLKYQMDFEPSPEAALKNILVKLWQQGKREKEIKAAVNQVIKELKRESPQPFVIFTECNLPQAEEVARALEEQLKISVKPVLVAQLKEEMDKISNPEDCLLAVITTGFHLNEVRKIVSDIPVDIHVLITQMSPETWSKLATLSQTARLGFICKDQETIILYEDLLRAELGEDISLVSCIIEEENKMREIVNSADVLLVTPAAYEPVIQLAPPGKKIFNVFDRLDPLTLKMIQASIARKLSSGEGFKSSVGKNH